MKSHSRRIFLGTIFGFGLTSLTSGFLYVVFRYLAPRKNTSLQKQVKFIETDIPAGGAKFFEFDGKSAVIIRRHDGTLAAFSAVCTHLGCVVQWQKEKDQFLCPCHAGLYNSDGAVISGPPPKPLAKLKFELNGDVITVG